MDTLGTVAHKPSFLLVDLSHVTPGDHTPKAPAPWRTSTSASPSHLTMECPPKTNSYISITTEVQEFLSHAVLDTSSQALRNSTTRRPKYMALWALPSARVEDSPKHVTTTLQASPQAATPDDNVPISHLPTPTLAFETSKVASISSTLASKTPSRGQCRHPA